MSSRQVCPAVLHHLQAWLWAHGNYSCTMILAALRINGMHTCAQDLEARYERLQMELVSSE